MDTATTTVRFCPIELVEDEAVYSLENALDHAHMDTANDVRIRCCSGRVWTVRYVCLYGLAVDLQFRFEPLTRHLGQENIDGISAIVVFHPRCDLGPAGTTTDLLGLVTRAENLGQQQRKLFVRPSMAPTAVGRRIDAIEQAWSPSPLRTGGILDDQTRFDELRQMLTDPVVVQLELVGQSRHVHRLTGIREPPEDLISRRVTKSPGLNLEHLKVLSHTR